MKQQQKSGARPVKPSHQLKREREERVWWVEKGRQKAVRRFLGRIIVTGPPIREAVADHVLVIGVGLEKRRGHIQREEKAPGPVRVFVYFYVRRQRPERHQS